jgi:hypothetical protein
VVVFGALVRGAEVVACDVVVPLLAGALVVVAVSSLAVVTGVGTVHCAGANVTGLKSGAAKKTFTLITVNFG